MMDLYRQHLVSTIAQAIGNGHQGPPLVYLIK
jgi:hypothetical protein